MKIFSVLVQLVLVVYVTHQSGMSEASIHETHYIVWSTLEGVLNDNPQDQFVPKSHMAYEHWTQLAFLTKP